MPRKPSHKRLWPIVLAIVLLALILTGLLQALAIMWTRHGECSDSLAQGANNLPHVQLCLRQHLGTTSEWLNPRLAGIIAIVGLPTAWKLWSGSLIVRQDRQHGVMSHKATVWCAYSSTVFGLLGTLATVLLFMAIPYYSH